MNAPDKLVITLSPREKGDINGWVIFLRENPQYIGVEQPPEPTPGPLPNGHMPWQTRIVLDEMTRARFEEIAAQFPPDAPVVQPPDPPAPPPPTPVAATPWPAGTFGDPIIYGVTLRRDESQEQVIDIDTDHLFAIPVEIPPGPWSSSKVLDIGTAEYQSPPTICMAWFSREPGKFAPLSPVSQGTSTMPMIGDCEAAGLKPGDVIFMNIAFWSTDMNARPLTGVHRVRTGGHFPR